MQHGKAVKQAKRQAWYSFNKFVQATPPTHTWCLNKYTHARRLNSNIQISDPPPPTIELATAMNIYTYLYTYTSSPLKILKATNLQMLLQTFYALSSTEKFY